MMYPSSTSSSSSSSHSSITQTGLTRYGSAPGSLLTTAVDALIADQKSYGGSPSSSDLLRQTSSPAGFLATTAHHNHNRGFTITNGTGSYNSSQSHAVSGSRLKSQLSFTGQDSLSLSHISEVTTSDNAHHAPTHSYAPATAFGIEPWDDSTSFVFSATPTKRPKNNDADILHSLATLESQFSLPQTTMEMANVEKLLHIPEDSVPCKISAKRGCATHPRSIAERERRTRISGKLKKLQDLVPNMDKQTSYADMLDLAVQHIKGLQSQVQKFNKELEHCSCGCKPST
ncbi:transcription factor bHLH128-like isoform X2 [Gastrolobium bilobum]|uniref:transcription factor bHLH128-like isoform X2 n=1 Tax=Gastrolobium bilobum TaxID=150636 RepID=UPI002AAF6C97|nr:transcription factor bHLH128-like isoform X2 [Gastrolobium bilobum]